VSPATSVSPGGPPVKVSVVPEIVPGPSIVVQPLLGWVGL
jgi:hypothetical protein